MARTQPSQQLRPPLGTFGVDDLEDEARVGVVEGVEVPGAGGPVALDGGLGRSRTGGALPLGLSAARDPHPVRPSRVVARSPTSPDSSAQPDEVPAHRVATVTSATTPHKVKNE